MAEQHLDDIDAIRNTIENWLISHLAGGGDLTLSKPAFPAQSGESSVTLLLDARYQGGEQKWVFRMAPPQSQIFDRHDIKMQYDLMEIMAQSAIPVPALVGYEPDRTLVGSDFYIMQFVDGQVPTDNPPFAFGSWVTELDNAQREAMWRNGLQTLARIHQIELSRHNLSDVPRAEPGRSIVQHEIDKFEQMLDPQIVGDISPVLHESLAFIKANAPHNGPLRLCWGDSRVGNIIWRELQPAAVIDWEMATLSDPLQDVSWWYWIDYINSVGLGAERLGGLPARAEIYEQWLQLTGLPVDNHDYFDLFSVLRYSIILERKFAAMRAAGMGDIDNFAMAFLPDLLANCQNR